jgi:hypothetical protein
MISTTEDVVEVTGPSLLVHRFSFQDYEIQFVARYRLIL